MVWSAREQNIIILINTKQFCNKIWNTLADLSISPLWSLFVGYSDVFMMKWLSLLDMTEVDLPPRYSARGQVVRDGRGFAPRRRSARRPGGCTASPHNHVTLSPRKLDVQCLLSFSHFCVYWCVVIWYDVFLAQDCGSPSVFSFMSSKWCLYLSNQSSIS